MDERSDGTKQIAEAENVFSNVPEDDVTGYALTYLESDRDQNYLLSPRL